MKNEVIHNAWDWVELDISTPSRPDATLKLPTEDWEYIQSLQTDGVLGKVRAISWKTFDHVYPGARYRGKDRSLLQVLFGRVGCVRGKTSNWLDLRRDNLEWGGNLPLLNKGQEGFISPLTLPPKSDLGKKAKVKNTVLSEDGETVTVDISTPKYPNHSVKMLKLDTQALLDMKAGRVSPKGFFEEPPAPHVKIRCEDGIWRRRPLVKVLYGEDYWYKTQNVFDVTPDNVRKLKKKPRKINTEGANQ